MGGVPVRAEALVSIGIMVPGLTENNAAPIQLLASRALSRSFLQYAQEIIAKKNCKEIITKT
jgi:hypothetical protein